MGTEPSTPTPITLFIGDYLAYSETFIYDQIRSHRRLEPWVCARRRTAFADQFAFERVTTLPPHELLTYATLGWAPTFARSLERSGSRLIHAHFGLNGVQATPFAKRFDVPLVVTFHGHDVGGLMWPNPLTPRYFRYALLARRMFEQASLLLCCSQELADRLLELGAPESKLRVHRLGIALQDFELTSHSGDPRVIMIGRLVEKKGFEYGLRAFAQCLSQHPEARLRIAGDGPLRGRLETLCRELGVQHAVTFLGAVDHGVVRKELQSAHVMLAPSVTTARGDRESGLIVAKEAGACGMVVIGSRHGGIPEIIDHERTGYLVPEHDVAQMAEHLGTLLDDETLRTRLGLAARDKMHREYDTVQQHEKLEALLLDAL